jgi:hypothetical protein
MAISTRLPNDVFVVVLFNGSDGARFDCARCMRGVGFWWMHANLGAL